MIAAKKAAIFFGLVVWMLALVPLTLVYLYASPVGGIGIHGILKSCC